MHNDDTIEKQAKAERVTRLIHPIQQRIHELMQAGANESLEHPSSNRVQELEKHAEEACWEIERLTPIFMQFQQKVWSTEQSVAEDAPKYVQEEEKEEEEKDYEEGQEDEEDQQECHQEDPEHKQEKHMEINSSDEVEEEIV